MKLNAWNTTGDVAAALGYSTQTVRQWVKAGYFTEEEIQITPSGRIRICAAGVERLVARMGRKAS